MIDLIAYVKTLIDTQINETAKQNLAAYATYPMLDYIGQLVGETRFQPQYAQTTIRASMDETKAYDVEIPAGFEIESKDSKVIFETLEAVTITAGDLYADVQSQCKTAGIIGNSYLSGEINKPVSTLADIDTFENTTTSAGGAEQESDDAFRQRIFEAPEKFTVAGSKGSYISLTKSAHQDIIDVAVVKPQDPASIGYTISGTDYTATAVEDPTDEYAGIISGDLITSGVVDYRTGQMILEFDQPVSDITIDIPPTDVLEVYPLTVDGIPSSPIKSAVEDALNQEEKIPVTDNRQVKDPVAVDFTIAGTLTVLQGYGESAVLAEVTEKLNEYIAVLKTGFKKDIVPAQINAQVLGVEGVYNFVPTSPDYTVLKEYEFANGSVGTIATEVYSG
jgi:phage-related baseplate assembly protein